MTQIAPRSGHTLKNCIDIRVDVVNSDYRGEVGVVLFNHGDQDFEVKIGDKIAHIILDKIDTPEVVEVQGLGDIVRESGGFGSSWVKDKNDIDEQNE